MSEPDQANPHDITRLLHAWRGGNEGALEALVPLVYDHLRGIARRHLAREHPGHTLTTAALVHEAYLDLLNQAAVEWTDRLHFYAIASRTMRRVLVWHARKRNAVKRGSGHLVTLDEQVAIAAGSDAAADELLALDDAMARLEQFDARLCRVVECRHFGGLSVEETAEALGTSPATVKRDWQAARAWLRIALDGAA